LKTESWTSARLKKLFNYYNKKYWKGSLEDAHVIRNDKLAAAYGICYYEENRIEINVKVMKSDKGVRSTLLHEMCHLKAGNESGRNGCHDSMFFAQVETLLRKNAPIEVGTPENPNDSGPLAIPAQYRLCRAAMKKESRRKQSELQKRIKKGEISNFVDGLKLILERFELLPCDIPDATWKDAVILIGKECHFLDIDDNPLPWMKPHLKVAKKKFEEARRNIKLEHVMRDRFPI